MRDRDLKWRLTWFSRPTSCPCLNLEPAPPLQDLLPHKSCHSGRRSRQNSACGQRKQASEWLLNIETIIYRESFVVENQLRMLNWKILSWNGVSSDLLWMLMYELDNLHGLSIFASHPSPFVATVNLCAIMNLMKRINSIISDKYCPIKQKDW